MTFADPEDPRAPTKAFLKLQSNKSRRQALQDLTHALTHQQVRDLQFMIDEVDFHCDIVAKLPIELIAIIFRHLPLCQIFQCRRVSINWRDALASRDLVNSRLVSWYPPSDSGSPIHDGTPASIKAEHVDAYMKGKAFSMRTHLIPPFRDGWVSEFMVYADGLFAWIDNSNGCVCRLLNLKTGEEMAFMTEDRSKIYHLALSSSMIAVIGMSGKCFVWTFREGKSISLRIPSLRVSKVLLSDVILAIAYRPQSTVDGARVNVIVWNLDSRKTNSLSLILHATDMNTVETKVMLDKKGESIVFFERPVGGGLGEVEYVYFSRIGLDGAIRAQGAAEGPPKENHGDYARNNLLTQVNQHATIWAFMRNFNNIQNSAELVRVRYDFRRDSIDYETHVIRGIDHPGNVTDLFFYKQAAYFPVCRPKSVLLKVIDFDESTCVHAPMSTLISWDKLGFITPYEPQEHCHSVLYGDEDFLVYLFSGGIVVWSFDKTLQMTNENIAYKKARQKKLGTSTPSSLAAAPCIENNGPTLTLAMKSSVASA